MAGRGSRGSLHDSSHGFPTAPSHQSSRQSPGLKALPQSSARPPLQGREKDRREGGRLQAVFTPLVRERQDKTKQIGWGGAVGQTTPPHIQGEREGSEGSASFSRSGVKGTHSRGALRTAHPIPPTGQPAQARTRAGRRRGLVLDSPSAMNDH